MVSNNFKLKKLFRSHIKKRLFSVRWGGRMAVQFERPYAENREWAHVEEGLIYRQCSIYTVYIIEIDPGAEHAWSFSHECGCSGCKKSAGLPPFSCQRQLLNGKRPSEVLSTLIPLGQWYSSAQTAPLPPGSHSCRRVSVRINFLQSSSDHAIFLLRNFWGFSSPL